MSICSRPLGPRNGAEFSSAHEASVKAAVCAVPRAFTIAGIPEAYYQAAKSGFGRKSFSIWSPFALAVMPICIRAKMECLGIVPSFTNSISPVFLPFRLHGGLLFAQNQRAASPTLPVNALSLFNLDSLPVPDVVQLTSWERCRKEELEKIVEAGLQEFLTTGAALREIRDRRLYRVEFTSFQEYVRTRFGLQRGAVDSMIRASSVAQSLLDAGEVLPPNTKPTLIRPIAALPSTELQTACWSLVRAVSPGRDPTEPLVAKVCRLVRNCLEDAEDAGETDDNGEEPHTHRSGYHRRSRSPIARETPFCAPVIRLSSWNGFNAELIISHIAEPANAGTLYRACATLAERCREVQQRLTNRFPQLEATNVEHHQS